METLKELLSRLYEESETRNEENMSFSDYESISYETGVQSTIKEIRSWLEDNSSPVKMNDLEVMTIVRVD